MDILFKRQTIFRVIMIQITPQKNQIAAALLKAEKLGSLNNSICNGEGNVYGFLGEIIVSEYIGGQIKNTYDFDIIKNNLKIEVKTKRCTSKPQDHYNCSVAAYNIKQKCDVYVFVRILEDFSKAWILGAINKEDFYKYSVFNKGNTIDNKSSLKWKFKADCYNLPINKLKNIKVK